ncbi:Hypothetical predicted protein [Marmota monax]|uniref:Uncharacterized protein n=1 Tax=Marmota monax TaxID=9995 RepID=A0A5E4A1V7_MARMO|nr:Hypothetical predicted protein [Marmota monax]
MPREAGSMSVFDPVQSLHTLNDQISHFIVTKSKALEEDKDPFLPAEKETLKSSMILMRHLLMDAQTRSLCLLSILLVDENSICKLESMSLSPVPPSVLGLTMTVIKTVMMIDTDVGDIDTGDDDDVGTCDDDTGGDDVDDNHVDIGGSNDDFDIGDGDNVDTGDNRNNDDAADMTECFPFSKEPHGLHRLTVC